jgi:hypothetical protein
MRGWPLLLLACGHLGFGDSPPAGDAPVPTDADAPTVDAADRPNIVFVTSGRTNGDMGGLAGADAACMTAARNGMLAGTFVAFLGTPGSTAVGRIAAGSGGWVTTDNRTVFASLTDLEAERQVFPIDRDELGHLVDAIFYTGTTEAGGSLPENCNSWSSGSSATAASVGATRSTNGDAFDASATDCSNAHPIACFEIDHGVAPTIPTITSGRFAFVTRDTWTPGLGVFDADMFCKTQAGLANLPGTYRALLATTGATASSRVPTAGPWRRPDMVPITTVALDALPLAVPINRDQATNPIEGQHPVVWLGAGALGGLSSTNTCSDWTSTTVGGMGVTITIDSVDAPTPQSSPCSVGQRLLCAEM